MPAFDLRRDAKTLLEREWLEEGEWLRSYAPVWGFPAFDGTPKPRPTAGQAWAAVGRFLKRAKALGGYDRIVFADGSGIDVHRR